MDRLLRDLLSFPHALISFVAYFILVVAFACVTFFSELRIWFQEKRTAFWTDVSREDEYARNLREDSPLRECLEEGIITEAQFDYYASGWEISNSHSRRRRLRRRRQSFRRMRRNFESYLDSSMYLLRGELLDFPQTLRRLVTFDVFVAAFACINFFSTLRTWFHETRTAFRRNVSRKSRDPWGDIREDSPDREEVNLREDSPLINNEILRRTINWQRMRQSLESYVTFIAFLSIRAFSCSLFAISNVFDMIGRPAWNIAFHQMPSTSKNESFPLPSTSTNESFPSPSTSTNESLPELEGLALRLGGMFQERQMMLSVNLKKSISSESQNGNIRQSQNHSSPQKRKVGKLESRPALRSETIPNNGDNQGKLTTDKSKKFRPSDEVSVKSSPKVISPIKSKANFNECLSPDTFKNYNPQEGSTPINARDISRRNRNEESRQERSGRQISPSAFYRINEGAGPSSRPDSVPWQEISREQDTTQTGKRKREESTKAQSPEKVPRMERFGLKESPLLPRPQLSVRPTPMPKVRPTPLPTPMSRHLPVPLYVDQKQIEQEIKEIERARNVYVELGSERLQKELSSLSWDFLFRREHFSSPPLPTAQIPSLPSQPEKSKRSSSSPYQLPGASHRSSQKSTESSSYKSTHRLGSPCKISLPSASPTANPKSPVRTREEDLNKQKSATSLEACNDLNKQPSCGSQSENSIVTGLPSYIFGTASSQNAHELYLDGSRGENTSLQGLYYNNSKTHDGSKPGQKRTERSQQESEIIRCSSSDYESRNKEFSELSMNENKKVQNLESSSLNAGLNTGHQSSEKSGDQQHTVSEKSTEGIKNPELVLEETLTESETCTVRSHCESAEKGKAESSDEGGVDTVKEYFDGVDVDTAEEYSDGADVDTVEESSDGVDTVE